MPPFRYFQVHGSRYLVLTSRYRGTSISSVHAAKCAWQMRQILASLRPNSNLRWPCDLCGTQGTCQSLKIGSAPLNHALNWVLKIGIFKTFTLRPYLVP